MLLGTRTMTCANASATKPFGAIDTPTQGGVASGANYRELRVGADAACRRRFRPTARRSRCSWMASSVGTADYNHYRPDIAGAVPRARTTRNGAIGFRVIDTTTLTNGLHTISWTVIDNEGAIEGIGSRFFTVSNGAGALTAAGMTAAGDRPQAALRAHQR